MPSARRSPFCPDVVALPRLLPAIVVLILLLAAASMAGAPLPPKPLEIGRESQFLMDLHVVDSTWGIGKRSAQPRRVLHPGRKHPGNPVLRRPTGREDAPWTHPSHLWVIRDSDGVFRMYYQANVYIGTAGVSGVRYKNSIGYAESKDGVTWVLPELNLFPPEMKLPPNTIVAHPDNPKAEPNVPQIIEVPEKDRRGYRYLMMYRIRMSAAHGQYIIGSNDGVRWDLENGKKISSIGSDHHNTLVYDPALEQYVMFLRAKHIYLAPGQPKARIEAGESRRGVARMTSPSLWSAFPDAPQTILMPDEQDAETRFDYWMGMPVTHRHGIYWGMLQPFRWNDLVTAEMAWSRDGIDFERMPRRDRVIELGAAGEWDERMIFANPAWVEVGDEWWLYYSGWEGDHESHDRTGHIGLAIFRREGFVSIHAPVEGGVVCTRTIRWPGGDLMVNADARAGQLRVRISDPLRKPIAGFNYENSRAFKGNGVSHAMKWQDKSLDALTGQVIRIEFLLEGADLYTFRAAGRN